MIGAITENEHGLAAEKLRWNSGSDINLFAFNFSEMCG